MSIVRIKNKYQVVIPERVRKQIGVEVGDMLEVKADRGKITLTPKSLVDRRMDESLADYNKGRSYGPFDSADELIASLRTNVKKGAKKRAPK